MAGYLASLYQKVAKRAVRIPRRNDWWLDRGRRCPPSPVQPERDSDVHVCPVGRFVRRGLVQRWSSGAAGAASVGWLPTHQPPGPCLSNDRPSGCVGHHASDGSRTPPAVNSQALFGPGCKDACEARADLSLRNKWATPALRLRFGRSVLARLHRSLAARPRRDRPSPQQQLLALAVFLGVDLALGQPDVQHRQSTACTCRRTSLGPAHEPDHSGHH